jgi:DNA-binding NarL/FixJ family response regulator
MVIKERVVLIESDERFLNIVRYVLDSLQKVRVVGCYGDCSDALRNLDRDQPDLIIMDIDFKSRKALEFISKAKRSSPRVEIMVITDFYDESIIMNVINSGATGFLLKQSCVPLLPEAVRNILKGGSPLDPAVARIILNTHQSVEHSPLTTKETSVLRLMMNGMTYTMIAAELGIAKETSKTHIRNIYKKLNVKSRAQAVSKAINDKLVPVSMTSFAA